jgi:hypothetical protein
MKDLGSNKLGPLRMVLTLIRRIRCHRSLRLGLMGFISRRKIGLKLPARDIRAPPRWSGASQSLRGNHVDHRQVGNKQPSRSVCGS